MQRLFSGVHMRLSLRSKNILGVAVIKGFSLSLLIFTGLGFLTSIIDDVFSKRVSVTSTLFVTATQDAYLALDLASFESDIELLMQKTDVNYVNVIGSDRQMLVTVGDRELASRVFQQDKSLSDVNDGVFDTIVTLDKPATEIRAIELGISVQPIQAAVARISTWFISIAAIELLLVAAFLYLISAFFIREIKDLAISSRRVKRALDDREFAQIPESVNSKFDLSGLTNAFNEMVLSLQHALDTADQQKEDLTKLNHKFEQEVVDGKQALINCNDKLTKVNQEIEEIQLQLLQAEKMASVGQLVAGVAHEINNPIGFVTSNMSMLKDYIGAYQLLVHQAQLVVQHLPEQTNPHLDLLSELLSKEDFVFINDDIEELITESKEGLARVAKIVQDLKLFSRVDNDDKRLFDINACIKTTLNIVNNELKYNCSVVTEFSAIPEIMMNVGKLTQVFTNLFINASHAIKATGAFGKITVSTSMQKDLIVIRVKDTGVGIPTDMINKIFNPFFTTKPQGKGTGLGLSVSQGIIAELDGKIKVESEVGKGCCFTIELPVNKNKEI